MSGCQGGAGVSVREGAQGVPWARWGSGAERPSGLPVPVSGCACSRGSGGCPRAHRAAPGRGGGFGRVGIRFCRKTTPRATSARERVPRPGWGPRSCGLTPGKRGCPRDGGAGAPDPPSRRRGKVSGKLLRNDGQSLNFCGVSRALRRLFASAVPERLIDE